MTTLTNQDITSLSVTDLAAGVAGGRLTPGHIADAYLARIEALEPSVQAYSYLDVAGVRAQAAALTAEAEAGKLRGPLHGVPVAIKDEFHVAGMPTGMRGAGEWPAEPEDATPVARLKAAGALILGKTYMPVDGVIPPTRNPWNLAHTAGGSSTGSGAAVGARMAPVAMGEQSGGSNLRPAAYCGIQAFKPSWGRISRFGLMPFAWNTDHPGVIGLTMADLALVYSVVAGPDPLDPTTLPASGFDGTIAPLGRAPKVGVVRNFFPDRTQPEMQAAVEAGAAKLKAAGADVVDVYLPEEFGVIWPAHRLVLGTEGAAFHDTRRIGTEQTWTAGTLRDRALMSLVPNVYYMQALRIRRWLTLKLAEVFAEVDTLLMATAPGPAPRDLTTTGDASLLSPWSFVGFPALSLNGGLAENGMPLGLQFVGGQFQDEHLLSVGAWCEAVLGILPEPPL